MGNEQGPQAGAAFPPDNDVNNVAITSSDFQQIFTQIDDQDEKDTNMDHDSQSNSDDHHDEKRQQQAFKLKKKICAFSADDIDEMLDEIHDTASQPRTNKPTDENDAVYVPMIEHINTLFVETKQLAQGGTCRVLLVSSVRDNSRQFALKEMSKSDPVNEQLFAKEIQLLRLLKENKHVVDFFAAYQTQSCYYIASAFCRGGTFLDQILAKKEFSEKQASKYVAIMLSAVQYMHQRNIVHRDLKLNNMVFDRAGDDALLKIIDFGDSDVVEDHKIYKGVVGTLHYLAPECMRARRGFEVKKSDLWCIGVIAFVILTGALPFSGASQSEIFANIKKSKFKFPPNVQLSHSARSFISGLLCKKTAQRMSAQQAIDHEWIKHAETKAGDEDILGPIKHHLENYNIGGKLHKIVTNVLFDELGQKDKKILREAFDTLGIQNKLVTPDEVVRYLALNGKVSLPYPQTNTAGKSSTRQATEDGSDDSDGSDIDLEPLKLSEVVADWKQSQSISVATFKKVMSKSPKPYDVNAIAKDLDPTASGMISLQDIQKYKKSVKTMVNVMVEVNVKED